MSSDAVNVSPEARAKNEAFLQERKRQPARSRYIRRHSKQARLTHGITVIACILLAISGLFVFVPPLAQAVGADTVFVIRMSHRVLGFIFVLVPLISAIMAPKGVAHIFKNLFAKWNSDDKKWMLLFFPYLFMAKWIHMPDQDEVKSGQRFADGMLWVARRAHGRHGPDLGRSVRPSSTWARATAWCCSCTTSGFLLIAVFGLAHIFLGGGIFQPYRGTYKLMFGNGLVSEVRCSVPLGPLGS